MDPIVPVWFLLDMFLKMAGQLGDALHVDSFEGQAASTSLYFETGEPEMFGREPGFSLALNTLYIDLIADHSGLICASHIHLNQLYFYTDRLVYCVADWSPELKYPSRP